jgi:hypothetical protein
MTKSSSIVLSPIQLYNSREIALLNSGPIPSSEPRLRLPIDTILFSFLVGKNVLDRRLEKLNCLNLFIQEISLELKYGIPSNMMQGICSRFQNMPFPLVHDLSSH